MADSGEVIPGLNEGWTLLGAKITEWMSGFLMAMMFHGVTYISIMQFLPVYVIIFFGVTFFLASVRRQFPDEERGVANLTLTRLGFQSPFIPPPASIQPYWSGAPIHEIPEDTDYMFLDLDQVFDDICLDYYGEYLDQQYKEEYREDAYKNGKK